MSPTRPSETSKAMFNLKPDDGNACVVALTEESWLPRKNNIYNNMNSKDTNLPFPMKLYKMLETAERSSDDDTIVSWLPCGKGFQIHNKIKFCEKLMPSYFATTNYKSFHRNLNLWGFGTVEGAYYNRYFVRGNPDLCYHMNRKKLKRRKKTMGESTTKVMPSPTQTEFPPVPKTTSPVLESLPATSTPLITSESPTSKMGYPLLANSLNPALSGLDTHSLTATLQQPQQQHQYPAAPSLQPFFLEQQQLSLAARRIVFPRNPYEGVLTRTAPSGGGAFRARDPMLLAAAMEVVLCDLLSR